MRKLIFLFLLLICSSWTLIAHSEISPIKPACQFSSINKNPHDFSIFDLTNIIYDEVNFKKEALKKLKLSGDPTYSSNRKWFKVKLSFLHGEKNCILEAKMRLTGDLNDHIEFNGATVFASLLIELKEESINGVKRFKLLLPQTRNSSEEVFVANLLSSLGFLTPRTSIVTTKLNGHLKTMIFQEDLVKEFLEFNAKVEGPIFEGDERFGIGNRLSTAKISNHNWAAKSKTNLLITENALSTINFAYLSHSAFVSVSNQDPFFDLASALSRQLLEKNIAEIEVFDSLVFALNASHLLTRDDSRFYFDPVMGTFHPIYYDGQPNFLGLNSVSAKFTTESAQRGVDGALKKLNDLNLELLRDRLSFAGLNFTHEHLLDQIHKLRRNLKAIKELKFESRLYSVDKSILTKDRKYSNASFLMKDRNGTMQECSFHLIDFKCVSSVFPLSAKMLAGKDSKHPNLIFIGDSLSVNFDKAISAHDYPLSILDSQIFAINDKTSLYATNNLNVYLNKYKREIRLVAQNPDAHALIEGGSLDGWHITYSGTKESSNRDDSRIFSTGLTGCLNFRDVKVKDLILSTKNTACEDAINTVRVSGTIKSVHIENAIEDGLDLDFSKLEINNISVKKAGNDCVDISYGTYKFSQLNLQNCVDKGLSSGETAKVFISNFKANSTSSGIVVKDGSTVEIHKATLTNSGKCVALYRKKSEFLGGTLRLKDINCDESKIFVQENSSLLRLPK
jgi:hypothetical protein